MPSGSPYLEQAVATLPRLLAAFDTDPSAPTFGQGDRLYWAWKLKDFGNATFQGAAHGLARLIAHRLLPPWLPETAALRRIDALFAGARTLTRGDGSLEEAMPYESSFCVTALVAFDLLAAIELLGQRLAPADRARHLETVAPMVAFLHAADERHAFISNHLATAAAALYKWSAITGRSGEARGAELLGRVQREASEEGWLREYQGADPGYQSIAMQYLAELHRTRADLGLQGLLERGFRFLSHFAHPDGSFGGLYGSRNTRFCFPAGPALSRAIPEAAALDAFLRRSVAQQRTVTLASMDDSNLVPMFNSYCWAAALDAVGGEPPALPCETDGPWQRTFERAGLLIDRGEAHYTIVSWHKGGVCYHFPAGGRPIVDAGIVARSADGRLYSTQGYDAANEWVTSGGRIEVRARFSAMRRQVPRPWQFIVLRLLNVSLMRLAPFRAWIKRALVRMLVTGGRGLAVTNHRVITLGEPLSIADRQQETPGGLSFLPPTSFSAIHMASQGYWQAQDDIE